MKEIITPQEPALITEIKETLNDFASRENGEVTGKEREALISRMELLASIFDEQ